jgi:hypothetical protein
VSWFGGDDEEAKFEGAYKKAIRDRLLSEAKAQRSGGRHRGGEDEAMAHIINNVYGGAGGHGGAGGGGGVMDRLGGGGGGGSAHDGEDPFDYLVDITREDLPGVSEVTGKPPGWKKKVHRYREEKKK